MFARIEVYNPDGSLSHVEDNRTVAQARADKQELINVMREEMLVAGLWYMGYFWDTSARARTNITGVISGVTAGLPLPAGFIWRDNNNNNVPFTATNLVTLGGYIIQWVNVVYMYSWQMKAALDAKTTLAEIDAYQIVWPSNNMDGTKPE